MYGKYKLKDFEKKNKVINSKGYNRKININDPLILQNDI